MRKLLLVLILFFVTCQGASTRSFKLKASNFYSLASDLDTSITGWDGNYLSLRVDDVKESDKVNYPVGTALFGKVTKRKEARRFYRNEYMMVHIDKVLFPDGHYEAEDLKVKIHPRGKFFTKERLVTSTVGATALTLGTIFDATVVGLPISRGGYAVFYSALEIHRRALDASRVKAGIIGFGKGLIFPIPQMLAKGKNLDAMTVGSKLKLDKEKKGKSIDAYLTSV